MASSSASGQLSRLRMHTISISGTDEGLKATPGIATVQKNGVCNTAENTAGGAQGEGRGNGGAGQDCGAKDGRGGNGNAERSFSDSSVDEDALPSFILLDCSKVTSVSGRKCGTGVIVAWLLDAGRAQCVYRTYLSTCDKDSTLFVGC